MPTVDEWARDHDLPVLDGHVQFPDVRIEYERPDGAPRGRGRRGGDAPLPRRARRGEGAAGFTCYRSGGRGRSAAAAGGRAAGPFDPRVAEEMLS